MIDEYTKKRIEHLEQAEKSLQKLVWITEVKCSDFAMIKDCLIKVRGLLYSYILANMTDEEKLVIRNLKDKGE